jgi:hypothetical protein
MGSPLSLFMGGELFNKSAVAVVSPRIFTNTGATTAKP